MLVESGLKLPPVDDQKLRAWFEANRVKYDEPMRYDFQEAVLGGDSSEPAVRSFVQALNAGAPGDAKAGLRVFKSRPVDNILQSYGADFAKALAEATPGEWRAPADARRRSRDAAGRHQPRQAGRLRRAAQRHPCRLDRCHHGPVAHRCRSHCAPGSTTSASKGLRRERWPALPGHRPAAVRLGARAHGRRRPGPRVEHRRPAAAGNGPRRIQLAMGRERQAPGRPGPDARAGRKAALPTRTCCAAARRA